jgi:hypothetical protein
MLCTTCRHPQRAQIDEALVTGEAALQEIGQQYGLSTAAIFRHKAHIPAALVAAKQAQEASAATTLLDRVETLIDDCRMIAKGAQRAKQWTAATTALREVRCCLELLGKLSGELQQGPLVSSQQNQVLVPPVINVEFVDPIHKELKGADQ